MNLNLRKSQIELTQSANILRSLQLSSPPVLSRYNGLMENQLRLESHPPQARQGDLGFVPLLIAGGAAITSAFVWLTSKQLTESTDYNARLKCVKNAMAQGASESEAIKICGLESGINFVPLAVAGVAGLALYLLLRK